MTTELRLADTDPKELAVDAVVVGMYSQEGAGPESLRLAAGSETVAAAFDAHPGGGLIEILYRLGATGEVDEVVKVPSFGALRAPVVAVAGLGAYPAGGVPSAETLRRAAGAAVRGLAGSAKVAVAFPPLGDPEADLLTVRAVAEGAALGAYTFDRYRSKPKPTRRAPVGTIEILPPTNRADVPKAAEAELARARVTVTAAALARDWVNIAPNDLRPPAFAEQVATAARDAGLTVDVLDEEALEREGFGGILAVGRGSAAAPRLVRLAYQPSDALAKVALVGKGITFDSGGLSIKPSQNMWEMKSDMAGAAAVAATMLALPELAPRVAVTGYLPMAENMPSGTAYRPGDVLRMRDGKLVEILNSDAEGRLLLADAIAWACEDAPDYLIETSTLTGGQVVSLGKRVAGVMGTPELGERVRAAGDRVGEAMWLMPLPEDVRKTMESDIADLLQVSAGMERAGHMLQGGLFLGQFVTEGVPWAHIDIAGPSYNSGSATGYLTKGGTGVPVRTLLDLIENLPG